MSRQRRRLIIQGVVQGVGFRPFIYRIATANELAGSVKNRGDAGVEVFIEGSEAAVSAFLSSLESQLPPLARVESVDQTVLDPIAETGFEILPSSDSGQSGGTLPPDVATCDACIEELLGRSRFSGYWATSCTDCGPRFTVIESLPYDRPRTSMREFPMCDACAAEYADPLDRRYHAQTQACAMCGPKLAFDKKVEGAATIERTVGALEDGAIVAIKGIGGTHLACDALSETAVGRLRARVGRPSQPYAIMATEEMIEHFADPTDEELDELRSPERPIVVLREQTGHLASSVAPGLHTIGVMLPYSGLHHLLFARLDGPLVMTSGNLPGRPMLIGNGDIEARLDGIADHFLLHDRRIVARCDDSVRRRVGKRFVFLRRSRGWVPQPIPAALGDEPILALGPETDVTFAIYANGAVTPSQHIGSVDQVETQAFFEDAVEHLYRITRALSPSRIACDLHPRFATTQLADAWAQRFGACVVRVQHHVAHLQSVMAEHKLDRAVGIVLDGYGYGWDGAAWGGELFVDDGGIVERAGHLSPVRLPGGDLAAREPLRMAGAHLLAAGSDGKVVADALAARGMRPEQVEMLLIQAARGVNAPWTTSAGRFLDAVSAWLGVCRRRTYEGEPAMRLEAIAAHGQAVEVDIDLRRDNGTVVVDTVSLFGQLVKLAERSSMEDVAATAQQALASGVARAAVELAKSRGIEDICFTGGVAYNDAIASGVRVAVESAGLQYHTNEQVPCGDGGIAYGQAAFVGRRIRVLEADRTDAASADQSQ